MTRIRSLAPTLAAILAPGTALAHPGHGFGFLEGVTHPLTGADHLAAMLAIGLWAAVLGGRAIWALPLAFMAALAMGGAAGHAFGTVLPGVEPGILASVMVLGAVTALALRVPPLAALVAVAGFGLVHGLAHGAESPANFAPYAAGFVLASAALHGLGLLLGRSLWLARGLGALTALAGVALAVGGGA